VRQPERPRSCLHLRALESNDLALFSNLYTDAETMRHIGRAMVPEEAVASFRATEG